MDVTQNAIMNSLIKYVWNAYMQIYIDLHSKSSFPKPDKSTFDENWVYNIIAQNYMRASNRVKFRSR